jgi:hypothetical protein
MLIRSSFSSSPDLFTSKEGVAQAKIKVTATGHDDAGYNFTFASAQAQAAADRNAFKEALTTILGRNRAGAGAVSATPSASVSASPTKPSTPSGATSNNARAPLQHPAGVTGLTRPGMTPRATSVASDGRSGISSAPGAGLTSDDIRLRKKVLAANPELAVLHRDLVMTGQITEPEFWEGRQVFPTIVLLLPVSLIRPPTVSTRRSSSLGCPKERQTRPACRPPTRNRRRRGQDRHHTPTRPRLVRGVSCRRDCLCGERTRRTL